jgi:hypothetical protein
LASSVTLLAAASRATSIIIDVEAERIIIVADSRAGDLNRTSNTVRDDQCKIVVPGERFDRVAILQQTLFSVSHQKSDI